MKNCGLVADVGGTNVRFALVDLDRPHDTALQSPRKLVSRDYAGLAEAARDYLSDLKRDTAPVAAVLAVAGPIHDGEMRLTNLHWRLSTDELRAALHIDRVDLINDYEAVAYAVPRLGAGDLVDIGPALPASVAERQTVAIVGPGTGLGIGGCLRTAQGVFPLVTEGGHADFAPSDDVEIEILKFLRRRYAHVSAERILSGPGLVNLHEALAGIEGAACETLTAQEITACAQQDAASFSAKVFSRFCAILGSVCGDVALVMGARAGVLIAGGILPAVAGIFAASPFRERFEAKGRFHDYMRDIPTRLIVQQYAGLMGAAAVLAERMAVPQTLAAQ